VQHDLLWARAAFGGPQHPPLAGDAEVDVAIVGGGIVDDGIDGQRALVQERRHLLLLGRELPGRQRRRDRRLRRPRPAPRLPAGPRRHRDLADALPAVAAPGQRLRRRRLLRRRPALRLARRLRRVHPRRQAARHPRADGPRRQPHLDRPSLVPVRAAGDRDAPFHDWYVWADRKPPDAHKGIVFPGVQETTWTRDKKAGRYYFHRFYEHQPDLNTANPLVQAEILKIMGFWLQLGVAGFRMDAVPFIIERIDPETADESPDYDMLRHFREFAQWRMGEVIMLAEANVPPEETIRFFGDDGDRLQMMFNFHANQRLFLSLATEDGGRWRRRSRTRGSGRRSASGACTCATTTSSTSAACRTRSAPRCSAPSGPSPSTSSTSAASGGGSRRCWAATGARSSSPTACSSPCPARRCSGTATRSAWATTCRCPSATAPHADAVVRRAAGRLHQEPRAVRARRSRAGPTATSISTSPSSAGARTRC
jgi:hypothetical protein